MYRYLSIFIGLVALSFSLNAQNNCQYQLILNDAGGDFSNNADISIFVENDLLTAQFAGFSDTTFIDVVDGDSISFTYAVGENNLDNTVIVLDSDGQVLVELSNPTAGVLFEGYAVCPNCPAIDLASVVNVDSFDTSVMIDWLPSDSLGVYQIRYAPCGFLNNPDSVEVTQSAFSEAELTGLRQKTCYEFQISIVCNSGDESVPSGPHRINTIWTKDVGISGAFSPQFGQKCDYSAADTLFVFLKNFGAAPQTLVPFDFELTYNLQQIGGNVAMPNDGLYTGVLAKDSCVAFPFEELIDISEPGDYTITMRTILPGDSDVSNDEFTYTFSHTALLPFFEGFDDSELPERWTADEADPFFNFVGNNTISSILDPLNSRFVLTTHRYGRIADLDSLSFKYAFAAADPAGDAPQLTLGDQLIVEISTDCGDNYNVLSIIDMAAVNPNDGQALTALNISLEDYIDELVNFRFTALRGGASFRILLDDINVYKCAENSVIINNSISNTSSNENNGFITVAPTGGIAPYTFEWSNIAGSTMGTTSTIAGLGNGNYTVTITDAFGCFASENFDLGTVSANNFADLVDLRLYPNPARDLINLDINLAEPLTLEVNIFNAIGQCVSSSTLAGAISHQTPISITNFSNGLYILQVSTPLGQVTRRFVVEGP